MFKNNYPDILLCSIFGIVIGISIFEFQKFLIVFLATLLITFAIFLYWQNPKPKSLLIGLSLVIIFTLVGFFRYQSFNPYNLGSLNYSETVTLQGLVISDTKQRNFDSSTTVKVKDQMHDFKINLIHDLNQFYNYGDIVNATGIITPVEDFTTETGRIFAYKKYLANRGIVGELKQAQTEKISENQGPYLSTQLLLVKKYIINSIEKNLPRPESSLAIGMLVGEKESLGDKLEENFRRTGLIHIVVLSGYNVAVVVNFITFFFGSISFILGLVAGSLGIIMFTILVGGGATVVRASLMALFVLLARYLGRPHLAWRGLLLAGAIMTMISPYLLWQDLSFQLSFIATAGLIWVIPIIERYFTWITPKLGLREAVVATFATQIAVFPLLMYSIGTISVISIIANVLVVPLVPYTMASSALVSLFNLFNIGFIVAPPAYYLHRVITFIVDFLAVPSWAEITLPNVPTIFLIGVYALIIYWIYRSRKFI